MEGAEEADLAMVEEETEEEATATATVTKENQWYTSSIPMLGTWKALPHSKK